MLQHLCSGLKVQCHCRDDAKKGIGESRHAMRAGSHLLEGVMCAVFLP